MKKGSYKYVRNNHYRKIVDIINPWSEVDFMSQLYKPLCRLLRPSVYLSVGLSVADCSEHAIGLNDVILYSKKSGRRPHVMTTARCGCSSIQHLQTNIHVIVQIVVELFLTGNPGNSVFVDKNSIKNYKRQHKEE